MSQATSGIGIKRTCRSREAEEKGETMHKMTTSAITARLGVVLAVTVGTPAWAWQECHTVCNLSDGMGHCTKRATYCTNHPSGSGGSHGSSFTTYGAIAYSPGSGAFGYSNNYANRSSAEKRALSDCGKADCVVASWFYNDCGAVAISGDGSWGGGHGPKLDSARDDAEKACARQGGTSCEVKIAHCSAE
jgi:Domain of unknown function (DUF4189)